MVRTFGAPGHRPAGKQGTNRVDGVGIPGRRVPRTVETN